GKWLVEPLSLSVERHSRLAIVGETGSGKSTLLKMIAGMVQPDEGKLFFEGKKILGPQEQLIPGHKAIAYLSQHYELRNNYVVYDYLDYGSNMTTAQAQQLFALCGIAHLLSRKTNSGLSGGEKQRIALAKLLLTQPQLLLLDEPFSNLDAIHKAEMKAILLNLEQQLGLQCILVSHDATDVLSWATRMLVFKNGQLIQDNPPRTVFFNPKNTYVAGLLGTYNTIKLPANHAPEAQGKQLFLRPSQIQLASGGSGLAAYVTQVQFLGDADMVEVQAGDQSYWAKTACNSHVVGDAVVLHWPATNNWYL
ncbi:MAG: ABC transporter ATP-binding protein, partial [Bacteroidetes bacterium]